IERSIVARQDAQLAAVAERERAEAVPLRLVLEVALGHRVRQLAQHRLDRRHHGQVHGNRSFFRAAAVIDWRSASYPFQAAVREASQRAALVTEYACGSIPFASSSHVIGTATGAPSRARGENAATADAPRALRR